MTNYVSVLLLILFFLKKKYLLLSTFMNLLHLMIK